MNSFSKIYQKLSFHNLFINTHLHFILIMLINITLFPLATHGCNELERRALLDFKSSMSDPANRLISWKEGIQYQNCCNWQGIRCSNESFHIISINLRNTAIQGKLSSSLFNITNLEYLDLSYNDFQKSQIPLQISHLTKLTHLDLKYSNFSSSISTGLANLTSLRYLDLSCAQGFSYSCLELSSTKWMSGLGNLQVLRLKGIDLSETTSSQDKFAQHISYLSNLRELDLSNCKISSVNFPIHQFHNLSRISLLKMRHNYDLISKIPLQLSNLTSLSILDLSDCGLHGLVPYLPALEQLDVSGNFDLQPDLTRMFQHQWPKLETLSLTATKVIGSNIPFSISNAPMLVSLSLSGCSIQGSLPHSIYNLSRLQSLDLRVNNITGYIHSSISNLKYLNHLALSYNNFQGSIPKSICEISPLRYLLLDNNNITGTIPSCISKLQNLRVFHVFANSIDGNISLISFINELNISSLLLGSNRLTVVIDQHVPLSNVNLGFLDLSSCNLKGLVPNFICKLTNLFYLDLSQNHLIGPVPSCISKLKELEILNFSNNKLSGSVPHSICSKDLGSKLRLIDISYNKLSGTIPTSIGYCMALESINLGTNNLTGNVPKELGQVKTLLYLQLQNNYLNGTILFVISNLLNLEVLNLGNNHFEGSIPTDFGSVNGLQIISLRSNKFNGSIPEEIYQLQQLQILDLSQNRFSGHLPKTFGEYWRGSGDNYIFETDISYYIELDIVIKGVMQQLEKLYNYSSGIDLSSNKLDGSIPEEIGMLQGVAMLNLSHNGFSDNIPSSIGNMSSLGSLDLSYNILSGPIPQSLTSLNFLGVLNLSYNKLSGRIPTGGHFDTLGVDGWAYIGNDLLCGESLVKVCDGDRVIGIDTVDDDLEDATNERILFYGVVVLGIGVGFWGLFFVLIMKKEKWWFPYWRFVDSTAVRITNCI